jgi:hypothetical protein
LVLPPAPKIGGTPRIDGAFSPQEYVRNST